MRLRPTGTGGSSNRSSGAPAPRCTGTANGTRTTAGCGWSRISLPDRMSETFLILLAGGVMLAAAVPNPAEVTLEWLRLAGIIALCMFALGVFFYVKREPVADVPGLIQRVQVGLLTSTAAALLAQLAFAQVGRRGAQRGAAALAFVFAVLGAVNVLHES